MKRIVIVIAVIVITAAVFVSCKQGSGGSDNEVVEKVDSVIMQETTAITDEDGVTHYYKIVSDDGNTTVLAEIETDNSGEPLTSPDGEYVTAQVTTSADDNEVSFDAPDENSTTSNDSTTENKSGSDEVVTDSGGWINKWY